MKTTSPTPWEVGGHPGTSAGTDWRHILADGDFGPYYIGEMLKEDAARTVACVNACAGIADPAATLSKVRELLTRISRAADYLEDGEAESAVESAAEAAKEALELLTPG